MKSDTPEPSVEKDWSILWWAVVGILVVGLVLVGVWIGVPRLRATAAEQGQFGDMFGVANAMFSGLAFAGVLIALFMQRRELQYQRRELRLTLEEVKRSANAQQEMSLLLSQELSIRKTLLSMEERKYRLRLRMQRGDRRSENIQLVAKNEGERIRIYKVVVLDKGGPSETLDIQKRVLEAGESMVLELHGNESGSSRMNIFYWNALGERVWAHCKVVWSREPVRFEVGPERHLAGEEQDSLDW